MKHLLICLILLGVTAQAQRPGWDENTRQLLITNMSITSTYTGEFAKQNAMLDTLTERMYRTLGEDSEQNVKVYKLNVYYDKKMVDERKRLSSKFDDFIVVVEVNRGVPPYTIKSPIDGRELTSMSWIVPWTLKPNYELYAPTNKQIKAIVKNKDKDSATYNWVRNGGLLMRKVSAPTKKLITQYSKK